MRALFLLVPALLLVACDSENNQGVGTLESSELERKQRGGKFFGEDGLVLGGGDKKADASPLGVNSFLWRATLDTLAFMPLSSADPFGGVILTDWHEDAKTPGERFKVNAVILDKSLRADGIKISLFKQTLDDNGNWRAEALDDTLERQLEDTILTRARELKVAQRQQP